MAKHVPTFAVACLTAMLAVLAAQPVEGSPDANPKEAPSAVPSVPYEKFVLANGLTVILHRDTSLPLVAVNVWYHVGPAHEPAGRSGFAHLFEHLMFEGSRHVGREFDVLLETVGATNVNGTTSYDRTNYFETVPREHLELALWIESDRMGFLLGVVDQQRLDIQREVVKNERRQNYDNAPYGPSWLALINILFPAPHPYHGAVIGSLEDLSRATLDDVRGFAQAFYTPGNASLALAGDFDPALAKRWITKYFGPLAGARRVRPAYVATPPLARSVRLQISEPVELARVSMGHVGPPAFSAAHPALEVAMAVLAGGKATRLYRTLVTEQQLASQVSSELDANGLASVLEVSALVASGVRAERAEVELDAVIRDLRKSGPKADELERAKRRILLQVHDELELLNGPSGETGRSGMLQRLEHYLGDPGYLDTWLQRVSAVTASDVRRVAAKYLDPQARVTVLTVPEQRSVGE